jgi:hypothetical protein
MSPVRVFYVILKQSFIGSTEESLDLGFGFLRYLLRNGEETSRAEVVILQVTQEK